MIVNCVYVHVKPEAVNKFIEATIANHKASVQEEGNLRFDVLQREDNSCLFMIYEVYESKEAADRHKSTPHYLRWRDAVKDFMAEPRQGIHYHVIEPSQTSQW